MNKIQQLKSEGHIHPLPVQKFHVSQVDKAFMTFAKGTHIGKLVIHYDGTASQGLNVGHVLSIYYFLSPPPLS